MDKQAIINATKEVIASFPVQDLTFLPPMIRGFVNNIIGDSSPLEFLSTQIDFIPDEQLPKIVEAARKIVAAADGQA